MATTTDTLQNFIDGERVPSQEDGDEPVLIPPPVRIWRGRRGRARRMSIAL